MIFENIFSFFFGAIMTFILQRMVGSNKDFFIILNDFKKKLPPKSKTATISDNEFLGHQHMILDTLKSSVERKDIDAFLKDLEDFDYDSIYFRKTKILSYSKNLQRIVKNGKWDLFTVGILQELLESKNRDKSKPYLLGTKMYKYLKC